MIPMKSVKRGLHLMFAAVACFAIIFCFYIAHTRRKEKTFTPYVPAKDLSNLHFQSTVKIPEQSPTTSTTTSKTEKPINIQGTFMKKFIVIFRKNNVPLVLFDSATLSELNGSHPELLHDSKQGQNTLHRRHLESKKFIIFAIEGSSFAGKNRTIANDLKSHGFLVHLLADVDPRGLAANAAVQFLPTHLWVASNDHVFQVVILHERLSSYMWIGPVKSDDWQRAIKTLSPALSDGENTMNKIGAKLAMHSQAFSNSRRFIDLPLGLNDEEILVPEDIGAFLDESKSSKFIECDYKRAREYKRKYESHLTSYDKQFKDKAKKLILETQAALDGIKVPFSLSSGSCLGWYRQCDIIPYTIDVDFDILVHNYNEKIVEVMKKAGYKLIHKFGRLSDSLEYSFVGPGQVKLDVFFVYEEVDHFWFSGIRGSDRQKYKYKLPVFTLCWTELLGIKIRVPCETEKYIEANYGKSWMVPKRNWIWNQSPPNLEDNGKWSKSDMKEVFNIL